MATITFLVYASLGGSQTRCPSLLAPRSCKCYSSIIHNYHYAQPHLHLHLYSHTIDTVNTKVTHCDRTRDSAPPLLSSLLPIFSSSIPRRIWKASKGVNSVRD